MGIERAFPTFYINIDFHKEEKKELSFTLKITGYYYCYNFEDINICLDIYNISNISKKQVSELLGGDNIIKIVEESIKNSMIPNDPIGILEKLWNEFDEF